MYRPRATKNEMSFERADRMEANKQKRLVEFFAAFTVMEEIRKMCKLIWQTSASLKNRFEFLDTVAKFRQKCITFGHNNSERG